MDLFLFPLNKQSIYDGPFVYNIPLARLQKLIRGRIRYKERLPCCPRYSTTWLISVSTCHLGCDQREIVAPANRREINYFICTGLEGMVYFWKYLFSISLHLHVTFDWLGS